MHSFMLFILRMYLFTYLFHIFIYSVSVSYQGMTLFWTNDNKVVFKRPGGDRDVNDDGSGGDDDKSNGFDIFVKCQTIRSIQ